MFVVNREKEKTVSLPAREIGFGQIKPLKSRLAQKILQVLSERPSYPMEIAKQLKVNEQKVYYHIRNLEKAKIIEVAETKAVQGAIANCYALVSPAFVLRLKNFEESQKIAELEEKPKEFLEPFIENGQLNALIVVGSPDPHGPDKARSRDGYYGIDLALFLGTFLNYVPELNVKLDTEVSQEDLKKNLILIGGPVVNIVTGKVNAKLPIRFEREDNWAVKSTISNKSYHSDETGIIVKIKNPFNPKKYLLLVAGKRYAGTRAVMVALLKHFKEVIVGNKYDKKVFAKVVEGVDLDSDGIVDDVEVIE